VDQTGKTTTGIRVPDEVLAGLAGGKRPPIRVTLNGYTYRTTVGSMNGVAMISVSADVRAQSGVNAGDELDIELELDTSPRELTVPDDLRAAIDRDPKARETFDRLSYSNRQWHVLQVESARTAETRERRIGKSVAALRQGKPR
jgi:hypothetical protein